MTTARVAAAAPNIISGGSYLSPPSASVESGPWWPYANSRTGGFEMNAATLAIIIICALTSSVALNTAIRCLLRRTTSTAAGRPDLPQFHQEDEQQRRRQVVGTTVVYSAGGRWSEDCAICLSEFEEGEGIQVLGQCNHGFHIYCIEKWVASHTSCPLCRTTCLEPSTSSNCCTTTASQCGPENPTPPTQHLSIGSSLN